MIDMHVHYFPPRVFEAIWRHFEQRGLWSIRYRLHGAAHLDELRRHGVRRVSTLVYAHKPEMADYLNDFVRDEAAREPMLLPFGTIYAGDGEVATRAARLFETYGFLGIKLHPFVSNEQLDDDRFAPAYEIMERLGKVLVCHAASAPVYEARDGATRLRRVLEQFPRLCVVVAHCGVFEHGDYQALADEYPHVYFDTAMNCVHEHAVPLSCPGRDFFVRNARRILFGSDFPNIPYAYDAQIRGIRDMQLGDETESLIFRGNAARLLNLTETTTA